MERKYIIFNVSEIEKIDFSQVLETSQETLRKSVDGTLTFVKYDGDVTPECVNLLETKEGPYTHYQFLTILDSEIWNNPNKEPLR
jgi:hypothetical protein